MNNFGKILKDTLAIRLDKAFGLDIGDRSLEIIELEKVFSYSVVTYGRVELPDGIVTNGRIIDQNVLAEKLKKLLKEAKPRKVSTNKVIICLPKSQVFVQCFEVDAKLKSNALSQEIIDKAALSLPINLDKTYWDFIEKPLPDKTKKMITFFSISKDIANSYVKFCNSIGLEVVSLCIESLSLARIILKKSDKQSLILDIGSSSTNLSFFDSNDMINMSVTIPLAGEQIDQAIKSKLKIEAPEAESLKIKFGLKEEGNNNVRPIILPIIEDILAETKQAIDYYESTFKQKLDDVYIIGGTALMPGLLEFIKTNLKREVYIATGIYSISLDSITGVKNNFPFFANVIGIGMLGASGGFKDMNLLKKMSAGEVNSVDRLNLFKMGYLSRVNIFRMILNNKFVLIVLLILICAIFFVLLKQVQNYGSVNIIPSVTPPAVARRTISVPKAATSSLVISTSTLKVIIKAGTAGKLKGN